MEKTENNINKHKTELSNFDTKRVDLNHGAGGKRMDELISFITENIDLPEDDNYVVSPSEMDDSAVIKIHENNKQLVITTDSHTVHPTFFKGGNIGDLSIAGTVNDLTVMGAQPYYITLGMIIEEGFLFSNIKRIAQTIGNRAKECGVKIVAGDTKVMPRGMLDGIVTNTAGVGFLIRKNPIRDNNAKPGDKIIITGTIGDHGSSLIAMREGLELETDLKSDVAPFWPSFKNIISINGIHCMKDMTRGGFATATNEIAIKSSVCLKIERNKIPVKPESQAICDILGLEIMELSCEGRAIIIVDPEDAERTINELKTINISKNAAIVGEVTESPQGKVHIITEIGGTRILDKPYGEPIPRVC